MKDPLAWFAGLAIVLASVGVGVLVTLLRNL